MNYLANLNEKFRQPQLSLKGGCYQLIIQLLVEKKILVGKLGLFHFIPGTYIYTGRHQTNVMKRIDRHLREEKKLHWHIDFLTTDKQFFISHVAVFIDQFDECLINKDYGMMSRSIIHPAGFGAGDCRSKCGGHLGFQENFFEKFYLNWLSNFPEAHLFKIGNKLNFSTIGSSEKNA